MQAPTKVLRVRACCHLPRAHSTVALSTEGSLSLAGPFPMCQRSGMTSPSSRNLLPRPLSHYPCIWDKRMHHCRWVPALGPWPGYTLVSSELPQRALGMPEPVGSRGKHTWVQGLASPLPGRAGPWSGLNLCCPRWEMELKAGSSPSHRCVPGVASAGPAEEPDQARVQLQLTAAHSRTQGCPQRLPDCAIPVPRGVLAQ